MVGAPASRSDATPADEARQIYKQATIEFTLARYGEAARLYESAYALHPDAALLYNAAQSHRLAGNKQRALGLYQNYRRLYADKAGNVAEVERFIAQLKAAVASEPPPPAPVVKPPPPAPPPAPIVERPPPKPRPRWLWPVVGATAGIVVVGLGVGLGPAFGLPKTRDPSPTLGAITWPSPAQA